MSDTRITKDYQMFKFKDCNRKIVPSHVKYMISTIQENNQLHKNPIKVNRDFEIIDGQHRLKAAEFLDVPIYYKVDLDATDEDMIIINANQRNWNLSNYVNYFAVNGYPEYLKLKEYCQDKKISYSDVFYQRGGKAFKIIRKGKFRFFDDKELEKFENRMKKIQFYQETMKKYLITNSELLGHKGFKTALSMIIKNEDIHWDTFIAKSVIKSDAIKSCSSAQAYYCLFLDIYNWKNKNKVYQNIKPELESA